MYSSDEIRAKLMDGAVESIGRCAELVNAYCEGKLHIPVYLYTVDYNSRFHHTAPRSKLRNLA
jgi:hypothetical protein